MCIYIYIYIYIHQCNPPRPLGLRAGRPPVPNHLSPVPGEGFTPPLPQEAISEPPGRILEPPGRILELPGKILKLPEIDFAAPGHYFQTLQASNFPIILSKPLQAFPCLSEPPSLQTSKPPSLQGPRRDARSVNNHLGLNRS